MGFLLKLHDTRGSVSILCLYYRYLDFILYIVGVICSILLRSLFPIVVVTLLCGGSYLRMQTHKEDKVEKEVCLVMGWLHTILGGCVLMMAFLL